MKFTCREKTAIIESVANVLSQEYGIPADEAMKIVRYKRIQNLQN